MSVLSGLKTAHASRVVNGCGRRWETKTGGQYSATAAVVATARSPPVASTYVNSVTASNTRILRRRMSTGHSSAAARTSHGQSARRSG